MKAFNRITLACIGLLLFVEVVGSLLILSTGEKNKNKSYQVEINRMMHQVEAGDLAGVLEKGRNGYAYVTGVEYIPSESSLGTLERFYKGSGVPSQESFLIRPVIEGDQITGYLRFLYQNSQGDSSNISLLVFNCAIWLVLLMVILLLHFIKDEILKPFHQIKELPYELSKGHLSTHLSESKNRFFGKFLWGLDLLRETLEQHQRRALELEREKKMMLLSISHDIKTPLSTIKLYAKALEDNLYDSPEKMNQAAKGIEEKVDQIEGFVTDIIKMSTTDIVDIQVTPGEFYLKDLIEGIHKGYDEKLRWIKTEFQVEAFENKLLKGDMDKLLEVVENLIENAIKYGDGRRISISFSEEDYCQLLTIENTGVPVSSGEMVHMFESFWRGTNATSKKGSGLGLYICKQIMLKMGGEIFAQNLGDGMAMTLVIPM